jgi:hypothetical protein
MPDGHAAGILGDADVDMREVPPRRVELGDAANQRPTVFKSRGLSGERMLNPHLLRHKNRLLHLVALGQERLDGEGRVAREVAGRTVDVLVEVGPEVHRDLDHQIRRLLLELVLVLRDGLQLGTPAQIEIELLFHEPFGRLGRPRRVPSYEDIFSSNFWTSSMRCSVKSSGYFDDDTCNSIPGSFPA